MATKSADKSNLTWEKCIRIASKVHQASRHETCPSVGALVAHMRRCSIALASRLADAQCRTNRAERVRLFVLARTTLLELDTQIRVCIELGVLEPGFAIEHDLAEIKAALAAAIQQLREQRNFDYRLRSITYVP